MSCANWTETALSSARTRPVPQPERGKADADHKRNMAAGDQPFRNGSKPDLKSVKGLSALPPESGRIGDVERCRPSARTRHQSSCRIKGWLRRRAAPVVAAIVMPGQPRA